MAHTLARLVYRMLKFGHDYVDRGIDFKLGRTGLVQITGDWPGVPGTGAFLQCGMLRSLHDQR
jgi:hypothetical protein